MNVRIGILAATVSLTMLSCGCDVLVRTHHDAIVAEEPAPAYIEEGAPYNGVVVAPADVNDYVNVDGSWYYWHPTLNVWVHANHGADWRPPQGARVYHHWADHPMYRKR